MTIDLEQRLRRELDDVAELLLREPIEPIAPRPVTSPRRRAPWILAAAAAVSGLVAAATFLARDQTGDVKQTSTATSAPTTVVESTTTLPGGRIMHASVDPNAVQKLANRPPDPGFPVDVIGSRGTRASFEVRSSPEVVIYDFTIDTTGVAQVIVPPWCVESSISIFHYTIGSRIAVATVARQLAANARAVSADGSTLPVERFAPEVGPFEFWSIQLPETFPPGGPDDISLSTGSTNHGPC